MITLKNVVLRRGTKVLLDGASVTLNPGEKVGLVGRNGAGKSSLFALFNGTLHEDGGECFIPAQWRVGQVAQDMPETDQSATDFVVEGDTALPPLTGELSLPSDGRPAPGWSKPLPPAASAQPAAPAPRPARSRAAVFARMWFTWVLTVASET